MRSISNGAKSSFFLFIFIIFGGCFSEPISDHQFFDTGATPNDLELIEKNGELVAMVVSSSDSELQFIPLVTSKELKSELSDTIFFPPDEQNIGANPWSVALNKDESIAAVSLFGQHKVALTFPFSEKPPRYAKPINSDGAPILFATETITLRTPVDVLGQGHTTQTVKRMFARHPQGLAFVGNFLLVAFSNMLEFADGDPNEPAHFGPGVLSLFELENSQLVYKSSLVLPCQNPNAVVRDTNDSAWVICTGVLGASVEKSWTALTEGAALKIAIGQKAFSNELSIAHQIKLDRFAPGKPIFVDNKIVVPSITSARVLIAEVDARDMNDGKIVSLNHNEDKIDSLFGLARIGGSKIAISQFSTNALRVMDVDTGTLNPTPFENDIVLRDHENQNLTEGPSVIATRTHPKTGALVAATILNLSAKLVSFEIPQQ